jgi:hypothetical protein
MGRQSYEEGWNLDTTPLAAALLQMAGTKASSDLQSKLLMQKNILDILGSSKEIRPYLMDALGLGVKEPGTIDKVKDFFGGPPALPTRDTSLRAGYMEAPDPTDIEQSVATRKTAYSIAAMKGTAKRFADLVNSSGFAKEPITPEQAELLLTSASDKMRQRAVAPDLYRRTESTTPAAMNAELMQDWYTAPTTQQSEREQTGRELVEKEATLVQSPDQVYASLMKKAGEGNALTPNEETFVQHFGKFGVGGSAAGEAKLTEAAASKLSAEAKMKSATAYESNVDAIIKNTTLKTLQAADPAERKQIATLPFLFKMYDNSVKTLSSPLSLVAKVKEERMGIPGPFAEAVQQANFYKLQLNKIISKLTPDARVEYIDIMSAIDNGSGEGPTKLNAMDLEMQQAVDELLAPQPTTPEVPMVSFPPSNY